MRALTNRWATYAGAPPKPVSWERTIGPFFGNTVATLDIRGRRAEVIFEQPQSAASLTERGRLELTS
jgi:hypothetical protein